MKFSFSTNLYSESRCCVFIIYLIFSFSRNILNKFQWSRKVGCLILSSTAVFEIKSYLSLVSVGALETPLEISWLTHETLCTVSGWPYLIMIFLEYKSSNIYIGAALWLMMTGSVSVLISLNPSLIISGSHKNILCHYIVISIIPNTPDITKRALIYIQQSRCHIASLCTICTIKNIFCQNCQNLRNI